MLHAVRTFRDGDGRLRRLGSKPMETKVNTYRIDCELAVEGVHGIWQPLPRSEILRIVQLRRLPTADIQGKIVELFQQLRNEPDAAKREQLLIAQGAFVAIDDGDLLGGVVGSRFRRSAKSQCACTFGPGCTNCPRGKKNARHGAGAG